MTWLIALALTIFIIFVPLPLQLNFIYEDNKLGVYVYNVKVYPTNKTKRAVEEPKKKTLYPKLMYLKILRQIYFKSNRTLFKSTLKLQSKIYYGLDDACATSLLFGILQSSLQCFYHMFSKIFRVKDFDINIIPVYNKQVFQLKIKSIIFINLAKIIYIILLIFICFQKGAKKYLRTEEVM